MESQNKNYFAKNQVYSKLMLQIKLTEFI